MIAVLAWIIAAEALALSQSSMGELNRQAIEMAQNGDLQGALTKFSLALEASPRNRELLNNLGVTLMRMGKFHPALDAFDKALEVDPSHRDASENRQELLSFMKGSPPGRKQPLRRLELSPRLKLPRITHQQLSSPGYEDYAGGRKPFVLVGATSSWPVFGEPPEWIVDHLLSEFPNSTADFYPHNMGRSTTRPFLVPLWRAIAEFRSPSGDFPSDSSYPGTYIQWNVPLKEWGQLRHLMHPLPKAFRSDERWLRECLVDGDLIDEYSLRLHWRMVLIGTEKAGMFFHRDVLQGSSWQVQVDGEKRWTLCDPALNQGKLYDPGDVDAFAPDLARFPRFADSVCYDDVVSRGEMVFYPSNYWHQTLNLQTPTISITGTVVDNNNYESVTEELQAECSHGKWKWSLSKRLCDALQDCFDLWDDGLLDVHQPISAA